MATYYIYRQNIKGTLSPLLLEHYAKAFRTLYCNKSAMGNPKLKMIIHGTWANHDKDGLFLKHNSGAEIVKIGRKYVTIEFKNEGKTERANIELTPKGDEGFSEIMFIEVYGA